MTAESQVLIRLIQEYDIPKRLTDIGARFDGSNAYDLIKDHGFSGILVDRSPKAVQYLKQKLPDQDVRELLVTPDNINDLVPEGTGILLMDVDGNEYWLWEAVKYKPEIVVIEVGQKRRVPKEDWIAPYDPQSRKRMDGTAAHPMKKLGARKGYTFYDQVSVNLFFLRNDLIRSAA